MREDWRARLREEWEDLGGSLRKSIVILALDGLAIVALVVWGLASGGRW